MRRPALLCLLACLLPSTCLGGGNVLANALGDAGHLFSAPARLDGRSSRWALGGLGAAALLYSADGQFRHAVSRNRTAGLDDLSEQAEKLGNGGYDLAFTGALAGAGALFRDDKLKETSLLAIESFLAANAVGSVVKYAAGRSRPYAGDGKRTFKPFAFKSSRTSFPSGHTVSAFAVASVYAARYESAWVRGAAYGAATLSALQRVYADKHWVSDIFAGAALGTAAGLAASARSRERGGAAFLLPDLRPGYGGLLVSAGF